jgi:hypothetical protein
MKLADIHSNAQLDVLDRHNYGGSNGFMRNPGCGTLTAGLVRVLGKPLMVSEYYPRREEQYYLCVFPIISLYGQCLNGWEFPMKFPCRRYGWGFYEHWDNGINYPCDIVQWPAMALAIRRGDLEEGPVVYARRISRQEVFAEDMKALDVKHPYELKYLAVGKVGTTYVDRIQPDLVEKDLIARCWDRDSGVVRSATGQLVWDYERGVVTCLAPRTQGAVGFLSRGKPVRLRDAELKIDNPFAAVWLSSLDGEPLAESDKVLVTLTARDGLPQTKGSSKVYHPVVVEGVSGTIALKSSLAGKLEAYAVDWDGRCLSKLPARRRGGRVEFDFNTLEFRGPYVLLTSKTMPLKPKSQK